MVSIKLNAEQIVDLIFEKEILIDNIAIRSKDSCLCVLSRLDQRLRDEKIFRNQNPVFSWDDDRKNSRTRSRFDDRVAFSRREKVNGAV